MLKISSIAVAIIIMTAVVVKGQDSVESDSFRTDSGELMISPVGHGTLMISFDDFIIHVDPVSREADYSKMPDANLILITHGHGDHLDPAALKEISVTGTVTISNESSSKQIANGIVLRNGDSHSVVHTDGNQVRIEAVPAYNIKHERSAGNPFHPKGDGNGYVITIDGFRIYIAGDTENIPEMSELKDIDVAFLPMNLPYTMTPEMVAEAAGRFKPKVLYPYHFGNSDTGKLVELLDGSGIEVRIRNF